MSAGGGKEIHFDSSALRAQYDGGGTAQVPVTDPAYVPEIVTGPTPTPQQLAENIPPDVLKAMANGGTPSPESLRLMMSQNLQPVNNRGVDGGPAPFQPPFMRPPQNMMERSAVELTIPVGNGVTARVTFTSQPARIHWRKLIRHLEIEAEDADESVPSQQPDLVALADAALRRAGPNAGHQETPQPKRRSRRPKAAVEANPEKAGE
jgi:hypothetical protein